MGDIDEFRKMFREHMDNIERDQEVFWNSLSTEEQLKTFCAIIRRIHKAEFIDRLSYRGVLYDAFEFDTDAYAQAQMAGYLSIHNAIVEAVEK